MPILRFIFLQEHSSQGCVAGISHKAKRFWIVRQAKNRDRNQGFLQTQIDFFVPRETLVLTGQLLEWPGNERVAFYKPSKIVSKPRNCLTPVTDLGSFQSRTTIIFPGSGRRRMPSTVWPKNRTLSRATSHFTMLQNRLWSWRADNTASSWSRCSFHVRLNTKISSRSGKKNDYWSIIGSAEALPIVREVHSVWERERYRERERERERRKWRHHFRAKIGDEFTLPFAKNSHNWRWVYTFPCQKLALFVSPFTLPVSPFTERSPLWRWNSQWVHTFRCQKLFRPLCNCSPTFKWHEPRDEWSKTQDKRSNPTQSYIVLTIEKMNQINTKNYWK